MISFMGGNRTPLEAAEMRLRLAVAESGWEHAEQDEAVEDFRREVLRDAAERIRATEARQFPGPILGAIRRVRANYYAKIIDPEAAEC